MKREQNEKEMQNESAQKPQKRSGRTKWIAAAAALVLVLGLGTAALLGAFGGSRSRTSAVDLELCAASWPEAFEPEYYQEPPYTEDGTRTNNAFNVKDFGEQGKNGWFYRYGDAKKPQRSKQIERFDGEVYSQMGANGLEIKSSFLHTSEAASPILEWRAAQTGKVNVMLTYLKNVNGDANPGYPDGVQLLVYKGSELLKLENVPISTTEELLTEMRLDELELEQGESLYFVVSPRSNNAFDGGSLYIDIRDVNTPDPTAVPESGRKDNNANSQQDFGLQGSNGWCYLCGTEPGDLRPASHELDGGFIDSRSPSLTISQGFIHPSLNHNAVLAWTPAVNGNVDLRVKYSKFEQHDGNPDFPDGVKIRIYKNDELLHEEHVDAPAAGENKISFRAPKLAVTTADRLYFMVDAEGNASYDGGAFDVTVIDVNGAADETGVAVTGEEPRQNFADVKNDFGPQGSNGWFFQSGWEDDPFHAYNMSAFDQAEDRYFETSWLEIKRDYVNPGEHGRSAVIKWQVAQDGTIRIKAAYTKLKNEDANPAWPDGTRVSLYHNETLLHQEYFEPDPEKTVTKRLDVDSLAVRQGDYIVMVINGLDNIAYDGGNYEFSISSLSGLVGRTERDIPATPANRDNFASTQDDFGPQGANGWYYQFGYDADPYLAVNLEHYEAGEKYLSADGVEIKRDYIVPAGNGKCANVKWVVAQNGRINIDLEYTKLKNEDANPAWPDGVTVYLMHNGTVLRKVYFAPLTDQEITKSLSVEGLSVKKGDVITMVVDPGENAAYDGGKYMFVIEDADKIPAVKAGDWDNNSALAEISGGVQGSDGWYFLEGSSPADAKVLTKKNADGSGFVSRRTSGLEMKNGYVHTGASRDPIYQWVAGKTGQIDVSGEYMKFGQQDANPNWPDGVTLKIWHNGKLLQSKKVNVLRGDGNNNVFSFRVDKLSVSRGDKLSFQICADGNNAWDGGQLSVVIEAVSSVKQTPGDDNNSSLAGLSSLEQGTDGWWFLEGSSPADAKLLTKMNADRSAYVSQKTEALEMKKDYVHPGASQDAIYQWVVAEDGKIDLSGSYVKFGQQDANPNYPDGVTLKIWHNNKLLLTRKVKVLQGDGNNNVVSFQFDGLQVHRNDKLSFQICADSNHAWDAGQLSVAVEKTVELKRTPGDDNNSVLALLPSVEQGTDGWWFLEGTGPDNVKLLSNLNDDKSAYVSVRDSGLEMKRDYVHPGATLSPIYQWVVKDSGSLDLKGSYVKFAHNDANPDYPDGVTLTIWQNDKKLLTRSIKALQGSDSTVSFGFEALKVRAGDIFSFQIAPNGNNAWDAGRLEVVFGDESAAQPPIDEVEPDPNRTNSTGIPEAFSDKQGYDGWYYGSCEWDSSNFTMLPYDAENQRYYNGGKPELKKDYVEPGNGKNAAYKWVVAQTGEIQVQVDYVKFANSGDPNADGTCVRVFLNGAEKLWMGDQTMGRFAEERSDSKTLKLKVNAGDVLIFAVNPEGNDAWDGGRLSVTIRPVEQTEPEPDPERSNHTVLAEDFSGVQGKNGWYYGACDWDSSGFNVLPYDEPNERYYDNGKPELKKDFVEPGNGKNAAYKWVAAETGKIRVQVDYVKFANSGDPNADGTCVRVFLNGAEKLWMGEQTMGRFAEERSESRTLELDVKAGDELIFAVNPESNDAWDAGRLSVVIDPATEQQADKSALQAAIDEAKALNAADYTEASWSNLAQALAEAETVCADESADQARVDAAKDALRSALDALELKPAQGADKSALQAAIDAAKALNAADYTESSWAAVAEALEAANSVNGDAEATQDQVDAAAKALNDAMDALEKLPVRTNNASLPGEFSGEQGKNGWYYGACDWDGNNFEELSYNGSAYVGSDGLELKADFIHPAPFRNAAYKWVAAQDGQIRVTGTYVKFANSADPAANGVAFRIRHLTDDRFKGLTEQYAEDYTCSFDETFTVKAGDPIIFQVDAEGGNNSYDGGKLTVTIVPIS